MDLYDKLGVKKNASQKEIKAAYRKKAKETHPDATGKKETQAEFLEVGNAHRILSNAANRIAYDNGEDPDKIGKGDNLTELLAELFSRIADQMNPLTDNAFDVMTKEFNQSKKKLIEVNLKMNQAIRKFKIISERVSGKDKFFHQILEGKSSQLKMEVERNKSEVKRMDDAIARVKEYKYKVDAPTERAFDSGGQEIRFTVG